MFLFLEISSLAIICAAQGKSGFVPVAIRRLRRYHVIKQADEGDRIEIPLFEQWVRERAIAD